MKFRVPSIMGVINLTPDSFYIKSRVRSDKYLLQQVESMLNEGAEYIDLGGQSTRPGAQIIGSDMEIMRVIPAIETIIKNFPQCTISCDTFYSEVAKMALEAGSKIINDISAGEQDSAILDLVARKQAGYIYMHKLGFPETMQLNPQYNDVLYEVTLYLSKKKQELISRQILNMAADPGFGFGKNLVHNFILLKHIAHLKLLEIPIVIGVSRKSMIRQVTGRDIQNSLAGTIAAQTLALKEMPLIIRTHDVSEAKDCLKLIEYINDIS